MSRSVLLLEPHVPGGELHGGSDPAALAGATREMMKGRGVIPSVMHGPPLGLAMLAAVLRQRGYEVIHEPLFFEPGPGRASDASIEHRLGRLDFDVAGLSVGSQVDAAEAARHAALIDRVQPGTPVVAGGSFPTFDPEALLGCGDIDVVIRGRGEAALPAVLDALLDHRGIASIPGACTRGAVSPTLAIEIPSWYLPPADFDAVEAPAYLKRNPHAFVQASRGCPFACPFCMHSPFWGTDVDPRPVGNIEHELRYLNDHGCLTAHFVDPTFTMDATHVRRIVEMLRGMDNQVMLGFETRADAISKTMLEEARRAGLATCWLGAESGSPRVLAHLSGKHHGNGRKHLDDLEAATTMLADAGLVAASTWIVGLPGESASTIDETLAFMQRLVARGMNALDVRGLALIPGTPYHDDPGSHGLDAGPVACGTGDMTPEDILTQLARVRAEVAGMYCT